MQVIDVVRQGREKFSYPDFHNLKSRQTYMSWCHAGIEVYLLLSMNNFAGLITTDGDSDLDNANYLDYNTKLGKIGYILNSLESHLQPRPVNILRSHNNIAYVKRNSAIKGDCSMFPGMGSQINLHDGDEFAAQRFPSVKLSALREAVKGANILSSTPKGKLNPFYNIYLLTTTEKEKSSFNLNSWHWKEKMLPVVWDKYWADALKRYNGDLAMLAQELELSFEGIAEVGRVFTNFVASKHVFQVEPFPLGITCAGWDFGFGAPTVCILGTIKDNDIIILDCYYASGKHPREVAFEVKKMFEKWGLSTLNVTSIGDPSGESKSRETGESSIGLYANEGIYIQQGENRILEGIQTINGHFYLDRLKINKTCTVLIDALNQAVFPTTQDNQIKKEEYQIGHPYKDVLDAFRYLVMYMVPKMLVINQPAMVKGFGTGNIGKR
jgi:hypothetical protein